MHVLLCDQTPHDCLMRASKRPRRRSTGTPPSAAAAASTASAETEYEVECVEACRWDDGPVANEPTEYLVKWKNHESRTWESRAAVLHLDVVAAFRASDEFQHLRDEAIESYNRRSAASSSSTPSAGKRKRAHHTLTASPVDSDDDLTLSQLVARAAAAAPSPTPVPAVPAPSIPAQPARHGQPAELPAVRAAANGLVAAPASEARSVAEAQQAQDEALLIRETVLEQVDKLMDIVDARNATIMQLQRQIVELQARLETRPPR